MQRDAKLNALPQRRVASLAVTILMCGLVSSVFFAPKRMYCQMGGFAEPASIDKTVGTPDGKSSPEPEIWTMHKQPYFLDVMMASFFGWVLGMVKGFDGSKDWLQKYWPSAPRPAFFVLDLLIFVLCGAYFGTGLFHPTTLHAAWGAGLSWPVAFGALATK